MSGRVNGAAIYVEGSDSTSSANRNGSQWQHNGRIGKKRTHFHTSHIFRQKAAAAAAELSRVTKKSYETSKEYFFVTFSLQSPTAAVELEQKLTFPKLNFTLELPFVLTKRLSADKGRRV